MFADVNGTRLYFERQGSGPTLLFIHGTTLDHRMWRTQVEAFAPRYDVITYDVRGFGKSAITTGPNERNLNRLHTALLAAAK